MAQRFGDRAVIGASLAIMTVGGLVAAFGTGYWTILVGRLLGGAGSVMIAVSATKAVFDWFESKEIATAMAAVLTGYPVGIAIALATLGGFAEPDAWRTAFWIAAAISCAALMLFLATFKAPAAKPVEAAPGMVPNRSEVRLIVLIGVVWAIFNGCFVIMLSFMPAFLADRGMALQDAALLVGLGPMCALIAVPLGGMIADRSKRPNLIIVAGTIGWGLTVALVVPLAEWPIAIAVLMVAGVFAGAPPAGPIVAAAGEVSRAEVRGVAMGLFYTVFYLGSMVIPPIAGLAIDLTGSLASAVLLIPAFLVLAMFVFAIFHRLRVRR